MNKDKYYFKDDIFVIDDYDNQKPFSSFLPGIAGMKGIPLWAFYSNRGQALASFGIRDKNGAIQEFFPANATYLHIDRLGFRTFIKKNGKTVEMFSKLQTNVKRRMEIAQAYVSIIERNNDLELELKVTYFGLPNEPFASLVRHVELTNLSKTACELEVIDGLSQILPTGVDYGGYKAVSNLLRSWMEVDNLRQKIAFYKLRAASGDEAEVKMTHDGNFYMSFVEGQMMMPIVDPNLIFGNDTSLLLPKNFQSHRLAHIQKQKQISQNKVACGFTGFEMELGSNKKCEIQTFIGYTNDIEQMNQYADKMKSQSYLSRKRKEAIEVVNFVTKDITSQTNHMIFDAYLKQNYLDNVLRGGYPIVFHHNDKDVVYHLYSRKHGDLERDYNFFSLSPEYYSQGNGNFRDVCQNRRNDTLFHPEVKDHNIKVFGNLIQADGYNPLGVEGSTFTVTQPKELSSELKEVLKEPLNELDNLLNGKFTVGKLYQVLEEHQAKTTISYHDIVSIIVSYSHQSIDAVFGEGYWQDHWTYILDLVETYEQIYPDYIKEKLFYDNTYQYYDSPVYVYPRSDKYVLTKNHQVRQFGAILHHDEEKIKRCKMQKGTNWLKLRNGNYAKTNLFGKLFVLTVNKFACLDPFGIGISYESNKPGWNDAMNGLPGLFGSGVGETFELKRLTSYLLNQIKQVTNESVALPVELITFITHIHKSMSIEDQFNYWDQVTTGLEHYREQTRFGIVDEEVVEVKSFISFIEQMDHKLDQAIAKAKELQNGLYPTFLYYEAKEFDSILEDGKAKVGHYGLPLVKVTQFNLHIVPTFLEGPARALKVLSSKTEKETLHQMVKQSELYDPVLQFYKTSVSLDQMSYELGRIRAFTKGWLERESNFLHMTYKYLYGLLEGGLYQEFFDEIKTNFVCFMDPSIYGRSTLENSSFLAPSNNPDPYLHGQGFFARLSGSTTEILSMWAKMFLGTAIFQEKDGTLAFVPKPILNKDFFLPEQIVRTTMLGSIKLTYVNLSGSNTYDNGVKVTQITLKNELESICIHSDCVIGNLAQRIRNKDFSDIEVILNKLGGKNLL